MLQAILPFTTAIALSVIAAYYSVIGLAQIFPGSYWPIIIMGGVLELSKLVTISWLYNNWNVTMRLMRYYMLTAIILLMLITSMGIFGFLSRAHIESNIVVGDNSVQMSILNQKEEIAKQRLQYLLKKAGEDPEKISRATDKAIQDTQAELKQIALDKLPLMKEENKLLAEVGPIKYIAELLYDKSDPSFIDKAVRVVIFIIIFVFDPLAVLLLIAANQSYRNLKNKEISVIPVASVVPVQPVEPVDNTQENDVKYFRNDKNVIIPKSKIVEIKIGE